MSIYYQDQRFALHHGDCVDAMRDIPAESIDAVVTSPPYAEQRKGAYGGIPEADYPDWAVSWMAEVRRVLKPSGSAIVNISPHRSNGNLSDYVLRTRLALRDDGWFEPDELIWHKPNATPGNPANRPRRAWESLLWFAPTRSAWSDPYAMGTPQRDFEMGRKSFNKDSPAKRNGWAHSAWGGGEQRAALKPLARVTNVATFAKAARTGFEHPAPFPVALADWCINLICPPSGTVLDPFSGSATTGVAALRGGRSYIGVDVVEDYVKLGERRLLQESEPMFEYKEGGAA